MNYRTIKLLLIGGIFTVAISCSNENIEEMEKELSSEIGINNNVKEDNNFESEIITGTETFLILSKDKQDSSQISLEYAYYSIDENGNCGEVYQDSINQLVADFVYAVSYMGEERIRPTFSIELLKESLPLFNSFYQDMIKDEIAADQMPWDLQSGIEIKENDTTVLVETGSYSYTGGAHGNGFVVYSIVSKKDGHDMKLSEFFKDLPQLNLLAAQTLKKEKELSENESLADAGFWIEDEANFLNENFHFENGDLIVRFNQYEIASYADGPIQIRVSKEELKNFLK